MKKIEISEGFAFSLSTVIESIVLCYNSDLNRSPVIRIHSIRYHGLLRFKARIMFIDNAKYEYKYILNECRSSEVENYYI